MEHQAGSLTIAGLLAGLWRSRWKIILPTVLVLICSVLFVLTATPLYRSAAKILIENQETAFNRPERDQNQNSQRTFDELAIRSQVEQLSSSDLVSPVIDQLKLDQRREFNPDLDSGLLDTVLRIVGLRGSSKADATSERVLENFFENLTVYDVEKSRVITVEFVSEDPELAAEVPNRVAEAFLKAQKFAKQDSTKDATTWLAAQVDTLRAVVKDAEQKVETFRAENGLFEVGRSSDQGSTLSAQQLGELSSALTEARAQRSEAAARARLIRDALKSGKPIDANDVLNSSLIQRLVEQQVNLRAEISEQSSTLLPQHPRMKELNAQLTGMSAQIQREAERIVRGLENEARIAAGREQQLQARLDALKTDAATSNGAEVQLRALEREADAQRALLESYLARYREAAGRGDGNADAANARIITQASVSSKPYFPKKAPVVAISTLAMFVFACGVNILAQLGSAAAAAAGSTVAGREYYPDGAGDDGPGGGVRPQPAAEYREPDAPSWAAAPFAAADGGGMRRILVTSVRRSPEIYTLALDLARSQLNRPGRVLLVDTDFGARGIETELGIARAIGLGDLVAGKAEYEQVMRRDPNSRLHIIPAGGIHGDPAIVARSPVMETVLNALFEAYQTVVLISAPVSHAPEAAIFASYANQAMLVTGEGGSEQAIARAKERLRSAGVVEIVPLNPERKGEPVVGDRPLVG